MAVSEKNEQELNRLNEEGKIQQDSMNRERREDIDGFRQGNKSIEDIERLFSDEEILEVCRESPLYEGLLKAAPFAGGLKVFESLKERIGLLGAFKPELLADNINDILLNIRDNIGRDFGIVLENNGTINIEKTTTRCRELFGEVPKEINDYIRTENIKVDTNNIASNIVFDRYTIDISDSEINGLSEKYGFTSSRGHELIDAFNEAWSEDDFNHFGNIIKEGLDKSIDDAKNSFSLRNYKLIEESLSEDYFQIGKNGFDKNTSPTQILAAIKSARYKTNDEEDNKKLKIIASNMMADDFFKERIKNGRTIPEQLEDIQIATIRLVYYDKLVKENPELAESYKSVIKVYNDYLEGFSIVKNGEINPKQMIDSINFFCESKKIETRLNIDDFIDENGNIKEEYLEEFERVLGEQQETIQHQIVDETFSADEEKVLEFIKERQRGLKDGEVVQLSDFAVEILREVDSTRAIEILDEVGKEAAKNINQAAKEVEDNNDMVLVKLAKRCYKESISNDLTKAFEDEYGDNTKYEDFEDDRTYIYSYLLKEEKFKSRIDVGLKKYRETENNDIKTKRGIGLIISTLGMLEEIENSKINYDGMSETRERCLDVLAELIPDGIVEKDDGKVLDKNQFVSAFNKMSMSVYKDLPEFPLPIFKNMDDMFSWCKEKADNNISFFVMAKLMSNKANIGNLNRIATEFDKKVFSDENKVKIDKLLLGINKLNFQKMTLTDVLGGYEGVLENNSLKLFGSELSDEDNKLLSAMSLVLKYDSPDKMGLMNLSSEEKLDDLLKNESDRLKVETSIRDAKRYLQELMPNMKLLGEVRVDREQLAKEFESLLESRNIKIPQNGVDILDSLTQQLEESEITEFKKSSGKSSVSIGDKLEKVIDDADKKREKNINISAIIAINTLVNKGSIKLTETSEYLESLEKNHPDLFEGEDLQMYMSDELHSTKNVNTIAVLEVEALKKCLWKLSGYDFNTSYIGGKKEYLFENDGVGKEDLKQKLLYCAEFYVYNKIEELRNTDLFKDVKKEVDLMLNGIDPSLINPKTGNINLERVGQIIADNDINKYVKREYSTVEVLKMARDETAKLFIKQLKTSEGNGIPMSKSFSESYKYLKETSDYDGMYDSQEVNKNTSKLLMFEETIEHLDKSDKREYINAIQEAAVIIGKYNKKYGINRVDKYFIDQKRMSIAEKEGKTVENEDVGLEKRSLKEKIEQQTYIKAMHFIYDNLKNSGVLIKTGLVDFVRLYDAVAKEVKTIEPARKDSSPSTIMGFAIHDFRMKKVPEDKLIDFQNVENNDASTIEALKEKEEKAEVLIRETHKIRMETEKKRRAECRRIEEVGRVRQIELINERRSKMGLPLFSDDYHKDADVQVFREERDVEIEKAKARHERNLKKREEKEARRQAKIQREKELQQRREEKKKSQNKEITEEEAKKAIKGKEVPIHMSNPNELREKKSDEYDNRGEVPVKDAEMEPTMKKDGVTVNVASIESLKEEGKKQENKSQSVKKEDEPSKTESSENQTLAAEEINTNSEISEEQALTDPQVEKKGIIGFFTKVQNKIKQKINELFNRKSVENNIESTNVVPENKPETNKKSQDFNSWVKVDTSQKINNSNSRVNSNNTNKNRLNSNRENTDYEGPDQDL